MDPTEFDDFDDDIPFELLQNAQQAQMELLPIKSRERYNRVYKVFKDWQKEHGVKIVSSAVILSYFYELDQKKYQPTSLWAFYSMLKATIRANEDIDLGKYPNVTAFLKSKSDGFTSKKAHVFTEENVKKFFDDAADLHWLDVKVNEIIILFSNFTQKNIFLRWFSSLGFAVHVARTSFCISESRTWRSIRIDCSLCVWFIQKRRLSGRSL